jgi:hypothetical protein
MRNEISTWGTYIERNEHYKPRGDERRFESHTVR